MAVAEAKSRNDVARLIFRRIELGAVDEVALEALFQPFGKVPAIERRIQLVIDAEASNVDVGRANWCDTATISSLSYGATEAAMLESSDSNW
jgi:hypothetical protein